MKAIKSFGGGDSVPLTFIIDKEKNIVFKKKGQTTYEELKAEILKILK
jgi:hypothetical protein